MSPPHSWAPSPQEQGSAVGGVGCSGGALGQCWGALGALEALWGGLPCPPRTGVPSVQEVLGWIVCWVSTEGWEGVLEGCWGSGVSDSASPTVEFPAPKSEVVQRFPVCYLGCVPVAKPVGEWGP